MLVATLALLHTCVSALAPLEPSKGILFGAWYDRLNGDSPVAILKRTQLKPFSVWQSDMNITDTLQSDYIDNHSALVDLTASDAILKITLYPILGFAAVSADAIDQFAAKILQITNSGRRVLIRYASEMNGLFRLNNRYLNPDTGNWFAYGQQAPAFIVSWKRVVDKVRSVVTNRSMYAFVWAPNSGNGYPFGLITDPALIAFMDTNKDGKVDITDDPYTPYYPGDQYVDWVGFSVYYYGPQYPWVDNAVAESGIFEDILLGKNNWGTFNFYRMFCQDGFGGKPNSLSSGGKPFAITETAATVHLWIAPKINTTLPATLPANSDPASRVRIKQAWWRQFLNSTLLATYPKIKFMNFFEFIKFEETTWRDFSSLGGGTNITSPFGNDGSALDSSTLAALQSDLRSQEVDQLIQWGNKISAGSVNGNRAGSNSGSSSAAHGNHMILLACIIAGLLL